MTASVSPKMFHLIVDQIAAVNAPAEAEAGFMWRLQSEEGDARQTVGVNRNGEDVVRGELIHDPREGWIATVDWSTQDVWEAYPPAVAVR